jgi:peptide/nickel transport system permease protein
MTAGIEAPVMSHGASPLEAPSGVATWPRAVWRFARRKPLGALGGFIVVAMLFIAVFVDGAIVGNNRHILAPTGYNAQVFGEENLGPSIDHPMGTDRSGVDIFSRVLYGIRISALIGLGGVLIASLLSLFLGTVSGYFGGWIDTVIQRLVDIVLAIPPIILLIYSISVFAGRSGAYSRMAWITVIVGFIIAMGSARVIRGAAISVSNNQYVDAARTLGATNGRIVLRHVVPNVIPIVIVLATVNVGAVILAEAAISFLGYGIPPPFPSLGGMLNIAGSSQFRAFPEQAIWPGVAIALLVYGFNMFGDALRDVLDPRLRGGR